MNMAQRTALRRVFTIEAKQLEELLNSKGELFEIKARFESLKLKQDRLDVLNATTLNELSEQDKVTDEQIEDELSRCSEYEIRFLTLKERVASLIENLNAEGSSNNGRVQNTGTQLRLPKIEINKFDGDLKNWIGFWGQFSKIHQDDSISVEDKFEYLKHSMKVGSPACRLMDGFPPSRENYPKAVELLKSRYGRDELLVEVYVRELLELVLQKGKNIPVAQLYDRLESQLRALESLGVTKEKYAAMLYPLVESTVPEQIFKVWERHRAAKKASIRDSSECLNELLEFLRIEVEGDERLKLRYNSFEEPERRHITKNQPRSRMVQHDFPSAAALVSTENRKAGYREPVCAFCDRTNHSSQDCSAIIDSTLEERRAAIKKKGVCFTCLRRGHFTGKCRAYVKCVICKGKHFPILCPKSSAKGDEMSSGETTVPSQAGRTGTELSLFTNSLNSLRITYLQTLVVNVVTENTTTKVRVLCDSGSQRSYITKGCVKELNLKPIGTEYIQQELFGGGKTALTPHGTYSVVLRGLDSSFQCEVNVLDQERICSYVPKVNDAAIFKFLEKKGIQLSDYSNGVGEDYDIQILLGADVWSRIITTQLCNLNQDLVAVKTKLGWSVIGTSGSGYRGFSNVLVSMLSSTDISGLWDLENLGIAESGIKTNQEEEAWEFFGKTVRREPSGRYVVKLPWMKGIPPLENNEAAAIKRLYATTKRLDRMEKTEDYTGVFQDWLEKKIIERVENEDPEANLFYLPHRPVFKEGSTTPVRPVFDASVQDRNGNSLNSFLETGPNLIEEIPHVLLNFRQYLIGLSADVEKAFLQIEIDAADRDVLRFLWWKDGQITVFRHCRVVFGITCSPFMLVACINNLLESAPEHLKRTANELRRSFYVDNCLTGVQHVGEVETFVGEAKELMSSAGFNLRGWVSNEHDDKVENVLGLQWYCSSDELGCTVPGLSYLECSLTKRTLLSITQKVFDPIGVSAPATLVPKLLLQKTWSMKLGWDDILPKEIFDEFYKWAQQLKFLEECRIPRHVPINSSSTLHVFCDASQAAYACCVYLRTEFEGKVYVNLLIAKSRVAPTKVLTIPRLELMAAFIGARLNSFIRKSLRESELKTYFWSDSTVALAWIKNPGPWSIFIENRVKEIRALSDIASWSHVPGTMNPADLLSRGCLPEHLLKSRWWEGPNWLRDSPGNWPCDNLTIESDEAEKERRKTAVCAKTSEEETITGYMIRRFSNYNTIVKIIAWILRFKGKASRVSRHPYITGEEFSRAESVLFRCIQTESLIGDKCLKTLHVYKDDQGILRMKSRVIDTNDSEEYTYPVVLPCKHPLVERMIEHQHVVNRHAGTLTLLTLLREKLWILRGRRTVSSVVRRCLVCWKNQVKAPSVPIPPLPKDRTTISSTFQISGVDLAGPLFTKTKEKCWIVIFTCAVYRAVHLELIQSLSSHAFIQALRRFIARRGRVSTIYSDNGTNFVGVNAALQQLDWDDILKESDLQRIQWKFNPPAAPWWGGFWERLIRILKDLLRKNLGRASLSYEELMTLLCECESLMNNRPLTYLSEEHDELCVLRPSLFLQSLRGNEVSDLDSIEAISLVKRLRYLQTLREQLRKRFKKEYLGLLKAPNGKNTCRVKVGDVVLVGSNDKKRIEWPIARVIEIFPGKDNVNRLVRVKTSKGCLLRSVQRLYPLEINTKINTPESEPIVERALGFARQDRLEREPDNGAEKIMKTRAGRIVKTRKFF